MAKIDNHKYTIEEAFRECFYIVPDYQREYIWTEKEVNQLLEDINDAIDSSSTDGFYFVGTVLVSPGTEQNHYEVIDGQQRLTTFFLLLCALKKLFKNEPQEKAINGLISTTYTDNEGESRTSLRLDPRYENASEIMHKLVELNTDPEKARNAIQAEGVSIYGSLENIINAYDNIYRFLKDNYQDKDSFKKYWGYLANKVVFIQISTDISSALKIFETINERGIGLNPMDLLKNLLFTNVQKNDFTKLKDEWKKITKPLEEKKEKPLRFLRYFLMANYKIYNKRKDSIVREDEIYDWFIDKKNASLCKYTNDPFGFVRKLTRNVDNFISFSTGKGNDSKENINMDNLKKLCGGAFSQHYILLLSASYFPKTLFDHFVSQLESFLFYYIFTKTPTKELEKNFSVWADELREISSIIDLNEQKNKLNEFLLLRFEKNIQKKLEEFKDDLKRYNTNSMQQYRTRYLLAKMTQYVDMEYKGLKEVGSLQEYMNLEIEHILPNNPSADLLDNFSKKNPGKDYHSYKTMLGNLALIEKPINIVASNHYFKDKCLEYQKCKYYLTSSIAQIVSVGNNSSINRVNKKLSSYKDWDASSIEDRQEKLIRLTSDIWKIEEIEL
jgi:uncharacterized protein with ParB-like and HNH nuclease domain